MIANGQFGDARANGRHDARAFMAEHDRLGRWAGTSRLPALNKRYHYAVGRLALIF
jgi:hypothetical protein